MKPPLFIVCMFIGMLLLSMLGTIFSVYCATHYPVVNGIDLGIIIIPPAVLGALVIVSLLQKLGLNPKT